MEAVVVLVGVAVSGTLRLARFLLYLRYLERAVGRGGAPELEAAARAAAAYPFGRRPGAP